MSPFLKVILNDLGPRRRSSLVDQFHPKLHKMGVNRYLSEDVWGSSSTACINSALYTLQPYIICLIVIILTSNEFSLCLILYNYDRGVGLSGNVYSVCARTVIEKVEVKVQVHSLVSSAKRHSTDFTQLPSGHRTCSFISHLNSPGSIQPGCHFRLTELFKYTSLHCPTRYPLTPGSTDCTCEQSAFHRRMHNVGAYSAQRGSNPPSLACTSRTLPLSHDASRERLRYRPRLARFFVSVP